MQGVFAGAIGVARGCVTVISDPSNEARAYAILGFCWGLNGVSGAIIGSSCQSHILLPFLVCHTDDLISRMPWFGYVLFLHGSQILTMWLYTGKSIHAFSLFGAAA